MINENENIVEPAGDPFIIKGPNDEVAEVKFVRPAAAKALTSLPHVFTELEKPE